MLSTQCNIITKSNVRSTAMLVTFDPIVIFFFFLLSFFAMASINAGISDCEAFYDQRKIRSCIDSTVRNVIIHFQLDFLFRIFLITILIIPNFWLRFFTVIASAKIQIPIFLIVYQEIYPLGKHISHVPKNIIIIIIKLIKENFNLNQMT